MRRVALLVTLVSAAPVLTLAAQGEGSAVGQRVRIKTTASSQQWLVGTLTAADGDSVHLWLQTSDSVRAISVARTKITDVEMSRGQYSNAGRGAIIGGAIFGTLGLIAGAACASDQNSYFSCTSSDAIRLTILAGLEGAGLGALIGAFSHSERWQRAPLTQVHLTVAPDGAGVGVSVAF